MKSVRNLVLVLGDQLNQDASAFDDFDVQSDCVWMAENDAEATYVWSHKIRLVLFFSAMRHFRDALITRGLRVDYHALNADKRKDSGQDFAAILTASVRRLNPDKLIITSPGDWRVKQQLIETAESLELSLEIRQDRYFYCSSDEFEAWAEDNKNLVLENFYRQLRSQHDVLMNGDEPVGEQWNLDKSNREAFGTDGPDERPAPPQHGVDELTQEVMDLVQARYPEHPGTLEDFNYPVTRRQALADLRSFIDHRLADFGRWQDAIWQGEHLLYHSGLSAALNLHLLTPRECVQAAVAAYEAGNAPLNSVEGFVRQILGWREFVRGVYWHTMPDYAEHNALKAELPVPAFFWDGQTDMQCVADGMHGVIETAYAHHIIRLMVLGLFALVAGVNPRRFHEWHMAMYADAIDWVSLPNALGMSQFGDGGLLGTKPYCASGNYINKMSNHCKHCQYNYKQAHGEDACPITTLYWDFLDRHSKRFLDNRRMNFQLANLEKKRADKNQMKAIRAQAKKIKKTLKAGGSL